MALPEEVLARLPEKLRKNGWIRSAESLERGGFLRLEPAEEVGLPGGEVSPGKLVEVSTRSGFGGTSVALAAIRRLQQRALAAERPLPLVAFVDPSSSLFGPGLVRRGVRSERLLVVRPEAEALEKTTLRLVESRLFELVVIDLVGSLGDSTENSLAPWVRLLRRMQSSVQSSSRSLLLLTSEDAPRTLPLPVDERWTLSRKTPRELALRVVKGAQTSRPESVRSFPYLGPVRTSKGVLPVEIPVKEWRRASAS